LLEFYLKNFSEKVLRFTLLQFPLHLCVIFENFVTAMLEIFFIFCISCQRSLCTYVIFKI